MKNTLTKNLTQEQSTLIEKEFNYLMLLGDVKDHPTKFNKEERNAYELYLQSCHRKIAVLIDCFEKRNKLVELGILSE